MLIMPITDESELTKMIESLREEMLRVGIQEGLASDKTISLSQKLDNYIAKFLAVKKARLTV